MWLQHPGYVGVRRRLVERFKVDSRRFRRLPHVVFLCGGFESERRRALKAYLEKRGGCSVFFAEWVWEAIAHQTQLSALEMENQFALLADIVVIIVESAGTFAELGAFSLAPELRKKLLPILDSQYENAASFINTGPVRWVNSDSIFAPAIYTHLPAILSAGSALNDRLDRLDSPTTVKVTELWKSPKHFLFFVCDLVSVLGPAPLDVVRYFVHEIVGTQLPIDLQTCVELGRAMDILRKTEFEGSPYYSSKGALRPYHSARYLNLAQERAIHLSFLEQLPRLRPLLDEGVEHAR